MAKKEALIIGGYKVPGARGGVAVLKACQLVRDNPGIKQGDLVDEATRWANLNLSTATWITTPGPKSPAGILWDRRKEGRGYRCYPNEHTSSAPDARVPLQKLILGEFDQMWTAAGKPVPGDLIQWTYRFSYDSEPEVRTGLLTGYDISRRYTREQIILSRDVLEDINFYDMGNFYVSAQVIMSGGRRTVLHISEAVKARS